MFCFCPTCGKENKQGIQRVFLPCITPNNQHDIGTYAFNASIIENGDINQCVGIHKDYDSTCAILKINDRQYNIVLINDVIYICIYCDTIGEDEESRIDITLIDHMSKLKEDLFTVGLTDGIYGIFTITKTSY